MSEFNLVFRFHSVSHNTFKVGHEQPAAVLPDASVCVSVCVSELEAYAGVISALRAQGDLTKDKKDLLAELTKILG